MPSTRKGQLAAAMLGAASGDPLLREASSLPFRYRESITPLGEGYYAKGGEILELPDRQARLEAKHRRQLETRKQAMAEALALEQAKLNMPTRSQATEARETATFLPRLQGMATTLNEADWDIPAGVESLSNIARGIPGVGEELAPAIERGNMDPDAIQWLTEGRNEEQEIMRRASGLAVTGFELENIKKWSPWASGLTKRERTERMTNIYNRLGATAAATMNQPWERVNSLWTPETEQPEMPEMPEGTDPEEWAAAMEYYRQQGGM